MSASQGPNSCAMAKSLALLLGLALCRGVESILPLGGVVVRTRSTSYTLLGSISYFGGRPSMDLGKNEIQPLVLPPANNMLLCQNETKTTPSSLAASEKYANTVILVARGECTFEYKAMNAQRLGASALIIYGTLGSRYMLNTTKVEENPKYRYTTDDIIYPKEHFDYDCSKGYAEIPSSAIELTPLPYNSEKNDPILSGDGRSNMCAAGAIDSLQNCPSNSCLLTGNVTKDGMMKACCAWDLHIPLYPDPVFRADDVKISTIYLTMRQVDQVRHDMDSGPVQVQLFMRYRSNYNISAVLIWALGVFVAALAAYYSAGDYRYVTNELMRRRNAEANDNTTENVTRSIGGNEESVSLTAGHQMVGSTTTQEETLELSAGHALGFIVLASSGLLILFFFRIYNIVKIMYGIGCSRAIMEVIFSPLFRFLFRIWKVPNRICVRTGNEDFGDITMVDMLAFTVSYALGISWLVVAFTVHHPEGTLFFWVMQDIMGTCMCITFLSLIKLNSINVASILLIVAFVYDIFFVFVTPLLFKGKSVMITVATSGGPPEKDELWCEKYPHDRGCQGGDPLPMLLTIPRIDDFAGGASLLGLGDIVLPGLLLSFAARLDAAKALRGVIRGGNGITHSHTCPKNRCCGFFSGGYFPPLVLAYAVGLFMANAAVYLMDMGQPALLYLVPCCLGSMTILAWTRNEFQDLWKGPGVLRYADSVLYGEDPEQESGPADGLLESRYDASESSLGSIP